MRDFKKFLINVYFYSINFLITKVISPLYDVLVISTVGFETFSTFINIYNYLFENYSIFNKTVKSSEKSEETKINFTSSSFNDLDSNVKNLISEEETSETSRNVRFTNPVFKYDFKSGDYFPKLYKEIYPHLFSTLSDITTGLRTAC